MAWRHDAPETTSRRGLMAGLALGVPVIAFGVRGVLVDADDTRPAELARWVIGTALVHDLAVVPLSLAVAVVVRRLVPGWAWPAVRTGLMATAVVVAVGWPLVRRYGADPGNPSLLPRDYGAGLAAAVGVVWLAVAAGAGWCRWRRRRLTSRRGR